MFYGGLGVTSNIVCICSTLVMNLDIITKLPESGDLCGNITEFGVAEGDSLPLQMKWYCNTNL